MGLMGSLNIYHKQADLPGQENLAADKSPSGEARAFTHFAFEGQVIRLYSEKQARVRGLCEIAVISWSQSKNTRP